MFNCVLAFQHGDLDRKLEYVFHNLPWKKFQAEDIEEGKKKALKILQCSAKRWKLSKYFWGVTLMMKPQKKTQTSDNVLFLRISFSTRAKILKAKTSGKCWRMYGEDVHD